MSYSESMSEVLVHFDATAARFDAIYASPRVLDRIFRSDMYERFQRTLEACHPVDGKTVLDVGCGSGQYVMSLAQRGAREVVGVDGAENMLRLAATRALRSGVGDRCRFVCGDFLSQRFDRSFDHVIAVGLFDYVEDPLPFLIRSRELTTTTFIATFPRLLTWRAPVRKARLALSGCPVFFYTRRRVVDLLRQAGLAIDRLERCGKLYWVAARPAATGDGGHTEPRTTRETLTPTLGVAELGVGSSTHRRSA